MVVIKKFANFKEDFAYVGVDTRKWSAKIGPVFRNQSSMLATDPNILRLD